MADGLSARMSMRSAVSKVCQFKITSRHGWEGRGWQRWWHKGVNEVLYFISFPVRGLRVGYLLQWIQFSESAQRNKQVFFAREE